MGAYSDVATQPGVRPMNATTVLPADWEVVPENESAGSPPAGDVLDAIAKTCRQRVVRRALFAAGVAMGPCRGWTGLPTSDC